MKKRGRKRVRKKKGPGVRFNFNFIDGFFRCEGEGKREGERRAKKGTNLVCNIRLAPQLEQKLSRWNWSADGCWRGC